MKRLVTVLALAAFSFANVSFGQHAAARAKHDAAHPNRVAQKKRADKQASKDLRKLKHGVRNAGKKIVRALEKSKG